MKQQIILGFFVIIGAVFVVFLFIYDIGLNSGYFAKRDFTEAFFARQTGNCEKFKSYHLQEAGAWFDRCIEERDNNKPSIKSFIVNEISTDGDRAFLQVELQRDTYSVALQLSTDGHKIPEGGYLVNYRMRRVDGGWFIDQDIKI